MLRRAADLLGCAAAAVAVALGDGVPVAEAGPLTVTLDPRQTMIRWTLRGFPDTVRGTFQLTAGAIGFDTESGRADGCLQVDARSGESGNASRDRKMHEQILESARFPVIALRPTHVDGKLPAAGDGALTVHGLLSLHGGWHPVTLVTRVKRMADEVTADGVLRVPYVAWGLTDPSVFIFRAAKTVELDLHTIGTLSASASAVGCGR